jgi:homoserine dehydrogenase
VLASITKILADLSISIEAFVQKEPVDGATDVDIILLTHRVVEGNMNRAIERIEALDSVTDKAVRIRVETLG